MWECHSCILWNCLLRGVLGNWIIANCIGGLMNSQGPKRFCIFIDYLRRLLKRGNYSPQCQGRN